MRVTITFSEFYYLLFIIDFIAYLKYVLAATQMYNNRLIVDKRHRYCASMISSKTHSVFLAILCTLQDIGGDVDATRAFGFDLKVRQVKRRKQNIIENRNKADWQNETFIVFGYENARTFALDI